MRKRRLQDYSYIIILLVVLAALVLLMTVASPYFFSWKNCRNILNQSAIYLVLSVGMTFVLCAGQIDLSVGSIIGFAGVCMGMLYHTGLPAGAAILAGLLIALGIGLVNGALVAYGKINSFIVTLSMMTILRGFVLIMTNSSSVFGFGSVFTFIGSGSVGPVNMPILLSLVIAAAGAMTLHKTKFGNYCLFLGSNEIALHRSGVNVKKYKLIIFAVCGLCAGVAGLIVTSRLNSAEPLAGQGYEMDAIAAAILGGTSMRGGKGSLIGTIIACLILNVLKNGLTLLAISSHYQEILTGIILLLSVLISESKERKKLEV
ncbi:ABC transporter permease [Massilistercora timonensis]|uniref:ABC transporter permease n=1 Tax=Massilistercora timonensis TaxID=2086584 RepID=UPI00320A9B2C